ncbi:MAG: class I SAM-dependent methyltransferase [Gemmatimonadota bacterium]
MSLGLTCLVCTKNELRKFHSDLLRCGNCGFVTAENTPSPADLRELYSGQYFRGGEYADYLRDRVAIQKNLGRRLRTVRKYVKAGFLVEVGSAYGFFLDLARRHFEVLGFELSGEAAAYARDTLQVPTRTRDFAEGPWEGPRPDVIVMRDVIEHLVRPDAFIERASRILAPGGVLCLTTGDIGSANARLRGARWRMIHPPTHLRYFSVDSLSRLLARYSFEIDEVSRPGFTRSMDQILYGALALRGGGGARLYRSVEWAVPRGLTIYLNLFDIMCVVARRAPSSEAGARLRLDDPPNE